MGGSDDYYSIIWNARRKSTPVITKALIPIGVKIVGSKSNPQPKSRLVKKQQEGLSTCLIRLKQCLTFPKSNAPSCRVLAHQCGKAQFANGRSCLQASLFLLH